MNYATQNVIVWEGLLHPDPKAGPARWAVQVSPAFWQRLAVHMQSPASRCEWERWLTPAAVASLCADETSRPARTSAGAGRARRRSGAGLQVVGPVPAAAVERLRETVVASLERPRALCVSSEKPGVAALYHLVLVNGASLILKTTSKRPGVAEVEDCFFSRAARESAGDALVDAMAMSPAQEVPTDTSRLRNIDSPAHRVAEPAMQASAAMYLSTAPADSASDTGFGTMESDCFLPENPACRREVVKQLVQRYAVVASSAQGLVPPAEAGESTPGSSGASSGVRFIEPGQWGFAGPEAGHRWTGPASDCGHANEMNSAAEIRRLLDRKTDSTKPTITKRAAGWGNVGAYPTGETFADGPRGSHHSIRLDHRKPSQPTPPAFAHPVDPLNCLPELSDAMRQLNARAVGVAMPNDLAPRAAFRMATALGKCRVFGVSTNSITDAALSPSTAAAAATELEKRMQRWCAEAQTLATQLPRVSTAAAEDLCLGLLEDRTDAWAAYVAIDECYAALIDSGETPTDGLAAAMDRLFEAADALDAALEAAEPHLFLPASCHLLSNWRCLLAAPYCQTPPWWFQIAPATSKAARRARAS